jgi:hypothetical protein
MYRTSRLTSAEIGQKYYERKQQTFYDRLFAAKHDRVKDRVMKNDLADFNILISTRKHTAKFEQSNKNSRRAQIV